MTYFEYMILTQYNDGWVYSTYTVYDDGGLWKKFEFTLATAQEGFIGIDFYTNNMYPEGCRDNDYTTATFKVYKDGSMVDGIVAYDEEYYSFIHSTSYAAGTYQVYVMVDWQDDDQPDYTVRTYFKDSVTITQTSYLSDYLGQFAMSGNV